MHGHGDKPYLCTHEGCDRAVSGNGFPRHWNLMDHMKRVHNDHGKPATTAKAPKDKKRKTKETSSSRKSSTKSNKAEAAAPKPVERPDPDLELWHEHQHALVGLANGFTMPDAPDVLQHIKDAQDHLGHMSKISNKLVTNQRTDVISRGWRSG